MRPNLLSAGMLLLWSLGGCSQPSIENSMHESEHTSENDMPNSLGELSSRLRHCLAVLKREQADRSVTDELTNLVSWTPELAADTNIVEARWIPIYELSEELRLSILKDKQAWDSARIGQVTHLCELSETAWQALKPEERISRFRSHTHDHLHDDHVHHGHDDHGHDDHGHHDHGHDDHGHDDHGHDDHGHHDHGHHDHGHHDHGHHDHDYDAHGDDHDHNPSHHQHGHDGHEHGDHHQDEQATR